MTFASRLVSTAMIVLLARQAAAAAVDKPEPNMDALEVMADLTLIDGACRNVVVNFGAGFSFATAHGIAEVAIMPGGARRAEFEAVLQSRRDSFGPDELCGQIARNYMEALPASIAPLYRRAETRP